MTTLPAPARWLIHRLVPEDWRESVAGDLGEERARRQARGERAGSIWVTGAAARVAVSLAIERRHVRTGGHPRERRPVMDGLMADLRHAVRALRAHPGYTAIAALTLTLGIGANAAVFNLANWLVFRPLPGVRAQDRLVAIGFGTPEGVRGGVSFVDFETLRAGTPALKALAAYQLLALHVAPGGGVPQRVDAEIATGAYFDVLDGAIALGRGWTADESANPGAPPVAVISHRLWTRGFAGTPDVIGRTLTVNSHSFTVVGVTTRAFHGASRTDATDVWVPLAQHRLAVPQFPKTLLTNRQSRLLFGLSGRLSDGQTVEVAAAQLDAARAGISAANPSDTRMAKWRFEVLPGVESRPWIRGRLSRSMTLLLGIVSLLLVLTCANVGNLMLARATARRGEVATRVALGASRLRVARLLGAESLVLSLLSAALAVAFTWGTAIALEGTVIMQGLPPLDRAQLDLRVLAYALAVSVGVACLAGVLPAFSFWKVEVSSALREAGRSQSAGRRRLRHALTTAQVAVSMVLLLGATLLTRSMLTRLAIDPGFDLASVLTFSVEPGLQGYGPRQEAFYRDLLDRVRAIPGVRGAGLAWLQPFSQGAGDTSFRLEGAPADQQLSAEFNSVSPGFFTALGLPIVAGRDFTDIEFQRTEEAGGGVVIITESLARRTFGTSPAIGRRIVMTFPEGRVRTVVGVVRDTRQRRVTTVSTEMLFEPFGQSFKTGWASVLVGLNGAEAPTVSAIRQRVAAIDPTLPIYNVERLDRSFRKQFADDLLIVQLTSAFSVLAMLLAAIGLHGVLARSVADRTREFGIRAALGATPGGLATLVSAEAIRVLAAGVGLGLFASWWLVRFIEARLFGITPLDAVSILTAVALVSLVTLLSSAPAARRAAKLDAASMLKT
ncbi:MAG TPA: ADOP family duplicated permease [Vicinamibacterales bacterium]|jgi:predicted permease